MHEPRTPAIRMHLLSARMGLFLDAQEDTTEMPRVEAVARLVDDALTVLDTYGRDVRGAPPEDWRAA